MGNRSDEVFDGFLCRELRRIVEEKHGFACLFLPERVQLLRLAVEEGERDTAVIP